MGQTAEWRHSFGPFGEWSKRTFEYRRETDRIPIAADSVRVLRLAEKGRLAILVSEVTRRELETAPRKVRETLASLSPACIEDVASSPAAIRLRDAYIKEGIVGPKWLDDALHVALATIAKADAIVSWNFRHIVRLDKMKAYNDVNRRAGYGAIVIVSPREVNDDESS